MIKRDSTFKLKAGRGTLIDTKNDKQGVLQIPRPLYEALHEYSLSARAKRRRSRTPGGDWQDQYLFLTQQGSPYYQAKSQASTFDPKLNIRHHKIGQPLRQFIKEQAIPYVREQHQSNFSYRVHDLRASFGMNMTEIQVELVRKGVITLHQARMNVKDLMWHENLATTDLYLNYRSQLDTMYAAINNYGVQLQEWIRSAMAGANRDE